MPTQLQIRRGSTTDHNSFTGAAGELTVDTTKDTLRVHDGSTAGGFELARADGSNLNNITSNITVNGTVTADGLAVVQAASTTMTLQGGDGNSKNLVFKKTTGGTQQAKISAVADDLRFTTGTTNEAMRIDSAGQVGIGTSSPATALHVHDNTVVTSSSDIDVATFQSQTANVGGAGFKSGIRLQHSTDTDKAVRITAIQANDYSNSMHMGFEVSNSSAAPPYEAMRIDYTGLVGIGLTSNTSTNSRLQVLGSGITVSDSVTALASKNCRYFGVSHADQETTMMYLSATLSNNTLIVGGGTSIAEPASVIKFHTGAVGTKSAGVEAMRINSSGDLVVGKTTVDSMNTVGAEVQADGQVKLASDGGKYPLQLNRLTTDGEIISLRKDGTTVVGSIGTAGGTLDIGSGDTSLRFSSGLDAIYPIASVGGGGRDAAVDLGVSSQRFKDLYLSGGAYLGGTAAANKLDDYEEGTWTPTLIGSTSGSATIGTVSSASYTKIGNLVHARVYCSSVDLTNGTISGSVRIGGFPFSAVSFSGRLNVHYSDLFTASPVTTGISGYASGTSFILRQGSSQVPFTDSDLSNTTNAAFMVDITYETTA